MSSYEAAKDGSPADNLTLLEEDCPDCAAVRLKYAVLNIDEIMSSTRIETSDEFTLASEIEPAQTTSVFKVPKGPVSTQVRKVHESIDVTPLKGLLGNVLEKSQHQTFHTNQRISSTQNGVTGRFQGSEIGLDRITYTDFDFHELVSCAPEGEEDTTVRFLFKREREEDEESTASNELNEQAAKRIRLTKEIPVFFKGRRPRDRKTMRI
ncbi:uncharacterized protein LOC119649499 isoform X2 [Hermetia illucens]|uniref:uncharacterized protein LOC119649499 isoform X1 n=1 Tax=Hermetia illucens TaxID=343691 RepID=UPI0018CC435E|nr:uncharacterized protein LOC119649499 isoform X1 [Hermetia illucens]XP_037907595.1 uncharacterized protein LOC119649499 isoform X2 [Hermetia illucens]